MFWLRNTKRTKTDVQLEGTQTIQRICALVSEVKTQQSKQAFNELLSYFQYPKLMPDLLEKLIPLFYQVGKSLIILTMPLITVI